MLDSQLNPAAPYPPPPSVPTEQWAPSIPPFQTTVFSGGLDPLIQSGGYGPATTTIHNPSPNLFYNLSPATAFYSPHNPLACERDFNPLGTEIGTLEPPTKVRRGQSHHYLIPKQTILPQGMVEDTKSNKDLPQSRKTSRRAGPLSPAARRTTALMRQEGACLRCLLNRIKVHNRCLYPETWLTVTFSVPYPNPAIRVERNLILHSKEYPVLTPMWKNI